MKKVFVTRSGFLTAQVKDIDGKKGIVTGYFSHFDNVDADGDIIRNGAFSKTIAENGPQSSQPRIKHLLNHDVSQPIGVLMSLVQDTNGLAYESQAGSHTLGQDFIKMVDSGLITEHSIGFQTMKRNQIQSWEDYLKNPDLGMYELTEIKLWEGSSLTGWGANERTPLTGMKGLPEKDFVDQMIQRQKNLEKFCRNSTASDETIELLLIECKQLAQMVLENTQPAAATVPPTVPNDVVDAIKQFTKSLKK